VVFTVEDAARVCGELWQEGVQLAPIDAHRIRAVTHLDVDRAGVERALETMRRVLA